MYVFTEDSGHGWFRAPKAEVFALGLGEKISGYSYETSRYVFLEEDCDMPLFFTAKGWANWDEAVYAGVHIVCVNNSSHIRNYSRFQARAKM